MTRISQALTRRVRLKSNLHYWFHPLKGFILLLVSSFCWRRLSGMYVILSAAKDLMPRFFTAVQNDREKPE